ncbi:MAG: hypothetical protein COA86_14970 [Kangiella sp.]|nr:MAG: hypothetical protein COA86_14970 [Kangiella sp.]
MGSIKFISLSITVMLLSSCATYKPSNTGDICHIFAGEVDWYEAARESQHDWGTPIYVLMAIMHQESHFVADAQPDRDWLLGFIPLPRKSSAYGYAQAQDPAWNDYMKQTGSWGADRDDFEDAIDFIGWYTDGSHKRLKISKWDTYAQYLAYHEGRGGYSRKTYNKKPWLIGVAKKVARRAVTYNNQLKTCQNRLDDDVDSWF